MQEKDSSVHKGHRKRMKEQLIETGIDHFKEHQILELLLFYTIPQGDTNVIAHRLLNECGGSLVSVLNSDYNDLLKVKGIGEHSATFFVLLRQLSKLYLLNSYITEHSPSCGSAEKLCEIFKRVYLGVNVEDIHAAAFTDNLELICVKRISSGGFDAAGISSRMLLDFALSVKSNKIVVAHNHPRGSYLPSQDDVLTTSELVNILKSVDVELNDHIIVGQDGAISMRSSFYGSFIWKSEDE